MKGSELASFPGPDQLSFASKGLQLTFCGMTLVRYLVKYLTLIVAGVSWYYTQVRYTYHFHVEATMYSRTDMYSRTADFKSLSTVTTMPEHQSNKTCRRWHGIVFDTRDYCSMRGQKITSENTFVKQRVTFLPPPKRKDSSSCPSSGFTYKPIPCCSSYKI